MAGTNIFASIQELWKDLMVPYGGRGAGLVEDQDFSQCSLAEDWAQEFLCSAAYKGFDPKVMFSILMKKNREWQADDEGIPISEGSDKKLASDAKLPEDLPYMLLLFSLRGSNYEKIKSKSSESFIHMMAHFVRKYDIDVAIRPPGTSLEGTVVTFPRIAATFPFMYCAIYHVELGKRLYEVSILGPKAGTIPVLGTTYITSCLSPQAIKKNPEAHVLFFTLHYLSDRVLHRKTGNYTGVSVICSYYTAGLRSKAMTAEARESVCLKWGLTEATREGNRWKKTVKELVITSTAYMDQTIDDEEAAAWEGVKADLSRLTEI